MAIRSYSQSVTHNEFSNFAPFEIELDGERWPTSEHYYQARKFADPELRARIRAAERPALAKGLANKYRDKVRADWADVKDAVMERVVRRKFDLHADLRALLLATGNEEIIEAAYDSYWGEGADGKGQNKLGRIIMRVRDDLLPTTAEAKEPR